MVPHNLDLAAFSPATANVVLFDPDRGADSARNYATKYTVKPEPWEYMETEDHAEANPTKRFLETRP